MTVGAVKIYEDKIEIGCDTQATYGSINQSSLINVSKMIEKNGMIFISSGTLREINLMRLFCNHNIISKADEEEILDFMYKFMEFKQDYGLPFELENSYILVIGDKVFSIIQGEVVEVKNYLTIGNGGDLALSALYLGHSVKEALQVACDLNIYCCEPIQVINIKKGKLNEKD